MRLLMFCGNDLLSKFDFDWFRYRLAFRGPVLDGLETALVS